LFVGFEVDGPVFPTLIHSLVYLSIPAYNYIAM
jgi:hypothetical protein